MTNASKTAVLWVIPICALLVMLVVFVRGAVSQPDVETYEGYFSPIYSPDGKYVYFVERSTSGTVEQAKLGAFFGALKFDVQVKKDSFTLKKDARREGTYRRTQAPSSVAD